MQDSSYKENKESSVWTIDQLNDYINQNYSKQKKIEKDWVYKTLYVSFLFQANT